MAKIKRRKLPVGVQSFRKIREEGYLYVDKTDIVWELGTTAISIIISVVLVDTESLCSLIPLNPIS